MAFCHIEISGHFHRVASNSRHDLDSIGRVYKSAFWMADARLWKFNFVWTTRKWRGVFETVNSRLGEGTAGSEYRAVGNGFLSFDLCFTEWQISIELTERQKKWKVIVQRERWTHRFPLTINWRKKWGSHDVKTAIVEITGKYFQSICRRWIENLTIYRFGWINIIQD